MSESEKKELKDKGFIIIEKLHIIVMTILAIITFAGGLMGYAAIGYSEKEKIKNQVEAHEMRLNEYEKDIKTFRETQLEIRINLKNLMEKQGVQFQTNN